MITSSLTVTLKIDMYGVGQLKFVDTSFGIPHTRYRSFDPKKILRSISNILALTVV